MTDPKTERDKAERKAFESMARYKFQMFGYWAAIWVHMNRMCERRASNPFRWLVKTARDELELKTEFDRICKSEKDRRKDPHV